MLTVNSGRPQRRDEIGMCSFPTIVEIGITMYEGLGKGQPWANLSVVIGLKSLHVSQSCFNLGKRGVRVRTRR